MELKQTKPLDTAMEPASLNRTKLELKPSLQPQGFQANKTLNRTKLELKHFKVPDSVTSIVPLNRTKLELKP